MDNFNSVPPASENVYGEPSESESQVDETSGGGQSDGSSGESRDSGMQRKGDRDKKSKKGKSDGDKGSSSEGEGNITGNIEDKLKQKLAIGAAKTAGKASLGVALGSGLANVGNAAAGLVKSALAIAKSIPAAIMATVAGVMAGLIACLVAVIAAVVPVADYAPEQPPVYVYRAAIGNTTSNDASLLSDLKRESARRIYTILSGFEMADWPSDWEGHEYEDTESYDGTPVSNKGTKKITYGLRPEQVFAVLGNWCVESGLDPTAVESIYTEPWSIGWDKQWAMSNDWVVKLWSSARMPNSTQTYFENYFKKYPKIHRNGIGLAQWTDSSDGSSTWKYDVHNPGRNSKLMRYAKLYAMQYYTAKDESVHFNNPNGHKGWNGEDWVAGDTTIEGFWYDLDVQLAFALDRSDVGDDKADWLWNWNRSNKDLKSFDGDKAVSITDSDFTSAERRGWGWSEGFTQMGQVDPSQMINDALRNGGDARGGGQMYSGQNSLAGDIDAVGDGTLWPGYFYGGEKEIDGKSATTVEADTYYDVATLSQGTVDWVEREYDAIGSYKDKIGPKRKVWYRINNGEFEIKYIESHWEQFDKTLYGRGDISDHQTTEMIFSTADLGADTIREQARVRAIDMANDYMQVLVSRWNANRDFTENNAPVDHELHSTGDDNLQGQHTNQGHIAAWTHTHCSCGCTSSSSGCPDGHAWKSSCNCPTTGDDACGCSPTSVTHYMVVEEGYGGTRATRGDSWDPWNHLESYYDAGGNHAQALANRDWTECFKYYYRQFLYEGMTAYYTAEFLVDYEGVAIAYTERLNNAFEYFDFWWDLASENKDLTWCEPNTLYRVNHMGNDIVSTENKGPDAPDFEDWFFHIEQPYAQGIITGINHTQDTLTKKQEQEGKIWEADRLMAEGDRQPFLSNKDLARAGCLIAWPTIENSKGNDGTELYQYIHDHVIEGDTIYKSCDRSVCTAVRWSGVDDNFPAGNTTTQLDYLVSSPNWVEIDWGGNVEMLRPGDILIRKSHMTPTNSSDPGDTAHHIVMYVGDWMADVNGKVGLTAAERASSQDVLTGSNIMHGSFGERSPGIGVLDPNFRNYHAFRCMFPMEPGTSKYVQYHLDKN